MQESKNQRTLNFWKFVRNFPRSTTDNYNLKINIQILFLRKYIIQIFAVRAKNCLTKECIHNISQSIPTWSKLETKDL